MKDYFYLVAKSSCEKGGIYQYREKEGAMEELSFAPLTGCNWISPSADGKYTYSYVDCDLQDRYFINKMYIFPIPTSETNNNSAAEQFDEWK